MRFTRDPPAPDLGLTTARYRGLSCLEVIVNEVHDL